MEVQAVIDWLNHLLETDRPGISKLFAMRGAVNNPLAQLPTIQTAFNKQLGVPTLGVLGILNSMYDVVEDGKYKGWGQIIALKNENELIERFVHVTELTE